MTNDLMERRLSAALDKTAPDDVAGVLSRCTERKGTVVPMKKKNQRMKKWMQAMAACLAVLLLGGGVLVQQAHAVTSVVSLDVNPSIELRVNSREKVVSCQALNDEAAAVLADMDGGRDLKGVKADVAVNAIVGSLVRCGYLDSLSSAILISVEDKDQARAQRLQQELTSVAGGALGDSQAAVLSQTVQQDKDLEKLAKANHISTGKAALIRQAMALNSSLTFEGLAKLSVEELRDLIEAGAPGMPIGMTAALEAAANYAGLTTADVADADVDPELDETPAHYEVELEVPGHGELEYRVDAYTGQVLSGPANVKLSAPVNPSGDIGMEAAKSAALKHAGLSSATFTKAERDYDDGRWEYELEFHTDTAAYEVTVDAICGSVLDYEKENLRSSSTSDIGAQAAKSAALRHAGLSEGQVQELQVEWDNENGRALYEVEFKSGGMEYEYVIDAATGSVLEHQAARDDCPQKSEGCRPRFFHRRAAISAPVLFLRIAVLPQGSLQLFQGAFFNARYIAAADAIGSSHLALGLGRVAVQAVAAADDIRLPGCQSLRNQPSDELLVLPALQVLLHGVVGPHHVLQVQGVARLIRLDGL